MLIVQGDDEIRHWLELAAEESELFWSIRSFADGRFALEHIWSSAGNTKSPLPDILITDFRTKGLSGVQLTRELRRYDELREMFIAFLVSGGTPAEHDLAESAGCDYFLRRPQSVDELLAIFGEFSARCSAKARPPAPVLQ